MLKTTTIGPFEANGDFTGDWVSLLDWYDNGIPAGSGFLINPMDYNELGSVEAYISLINPPLDIDYGATVIVGFEFGNAGGSVIVSADLCRFVFASNLTVNSTSSVEHLVNSYYPISWGSAITQVRCIATVSGFYENPPSGTARVWCRFAHYYSVNVRRIS